MNFQDLLNNPPKLHSDRSGKPISWGLSDEVLHFIDKHVDAASKTLETGAGVSTILLALKGVEHICIVPSVDEVDRIKEYCMRHRISTGKINFQIDRSENALPRLQLNGLDLVLIDGRHAFPTPFIDWHYASAGLKGGGVLIIDDTQLWTGRILREFLLSEPEWKLKKDFSRTAVFVKLQGGSHSKEWNQQPFVVRNSSSIKSDNRDMLKALLHDATVIVVSKGDSRLLDLPCRQAWHFPQTEGGVYAGYYPADSATAIAHLEALRAKGGEFLLFPCTAFWWLEHYLEFKRYLESHYQMVMHDENTCLVFDLRKSAAASQRTCSEATQPSLREDADGLCDPGSLSFRCNICGQQSIVKVDELRREGPSCKTCGSSMRWRSIIFVLSMELFGESLTLSEFPTGLNISGVGMSDWDGYARGLARKFNFKNTHYHKEPKLDITSIDPALEGAFDFVISSDVFEHVIPPVSIAFKNARRLLKPNGVVVLTVPYKKDGTTVEHFPDLHDYQILEKNGHHILRNTTKEGIEQIFENLIFHGGAGSTLEMRVFSESSLLEEIRQAGFSKIKIYKDSNFCCGIYWKEDHSVPMSLRIR